MLRKFHPSKNSNKFLISSSMAIIIQVWSFLTLISFVSITLAQEDNRYVPSRRYRTTNNSSEEDGLRIPGISIPSFEEIRETLNRFQAHLSNLRRNASGSSDQRRVSYDTSYYPSVSPGYVNGPRDVDNYAHPTKQVPKKFPFPYSASEPSAASDLQKHTTTTMYIMAICLIIMVVGTILFICVNKFQEKTGDVNSIVNGSSNNTSNTSSTSSLTQSSGLFNTNGNSRVSTNTISLAVATREGTSSRSSPNVIDSTTVIIPGANIEYNPRITYDLPPSYDSLYPDGKP